MLLRVLVPVPELELALRLELELVLRLVLELVLLRARVLPPVVT